jgi:predicted DNA-binding protein (MmcQ/YjbR family)
MPPRRTMIDIRAVCGAMPGATCDYPFQPDGPVFRIGGKIFAIIGDRDRRVSLKCDPALAEILRANYAGKKL